MNPSKRRWMPVAAVAVIAAGSQMIPATAHADLHNITYRARIDALTVGSQVAFVIKDGQTMSTGLSSLPGNAFQADTVLADPQEAGMQVILHWPYSANVHCEIGVDGNITTQADRMVAPVQNSSDPMNGVLACGAPLPS